MKLLTPSLFMFSLFVLGGFIFKMAAPTQCGEILPDDTVFVLTGDTRRIPFAMKQTSQIPNTNIYIIGAGAENYVPSAPINIKTETESKSTYQNAVAIHNIVDKQDLHRIVIVTTEEHMNRAEYLIRHELPDVNIVTCPATLTGMPVTKRLERWTTEYVKYIVTLFGIKEG